MGNIMILNYSYSLIVIIAVHKRVAEVQETLPEGIFINPIVDRSELIGRTTMTVFENLLFGCVIVILVVLLILGNLRTAMIIASIIPLSLLFTLSLMYIFGIDANLMSLGALDFGIIIDGGVIIAEFIALSLNNHYDDANRLHGQERKDYIDEITINGASKMMNSAIFGQIIILIVFVPIISLTGVEGKMFRPMALTFCFAVIGASLLGMTWLPVASALFMKPGKNGEKNVSRVMRLAYKTYRPSIEWACGHKRMIVIGALVMLTVALLLFG